MSETKEIEGFQTDFPTYTTDHETIRCKVDDFDCIAWTERDDENDPPWKRHDGHGVVSDWTHRKAYPGERLLSEDRGCYRYYDFAESTRIALEDHWGSFPYYVPGETAMQKAVRAAEDDFEYLRSWCRDEWDFCGVIVQVSRMGMVLTERYYHALWGIERNSRSADPTDRTNSCLREVANELLDEALDAARAKLAVLCNCTHETA